LDRKEPQKTDMDRSSPVRSGLFKVFDFEGPVSVPVLPKKGKRPDRTGLSNTSFYRPGHPNPLRCRFCRPSQPPNSRICESEHPGARFGKFEPHHPCLATPTLSALVFAGPATTQLGFAKASTWMLVLANPSLTILVFTGPATPTLTAPISCRPGDLPNPAAPCFFVGPVLPDQASFLAVRPPSPPLSLLV